MNYNQNEKIAQIISQTLIIGVDIAKYKHVARAQDFKGLEFSASFILGNTNSSFNCYIEWIKKLMDQNKMEKVIVGMEPTGYYLGLI